MKGCVRLALAGLSLTSLLLGCATQESVDALEKRVNV